MAVSRTKTGPGTIIVGEIGVDDIDFSAQVLSCVVEYDKDKEDDRKVLSGETVAGAVRRSATVSITMLNDIAVAAGIVRFSWANKGSEQPFRFVPNTAADQAIEGTIEIEPIAIGGDVDDDMETEFEWDFVGEPTLDEATP